MLVGKTEMRQEHPFFGGEPAANHALMILIMANNYHTRLEKQSRVYDFVYTLELDGLFIGRDESGFVF